MVVDDGRSSSAYHYLISSSLTARNVTGLWLHGGAMSCALFYAPQPRGAAYFGRKGCSTPTSATTSGGRRCRLPMMICSAMVTRPSRTRRITAWSKPHAHGHESVTPHATCHAPHATRHMPVLVPMPTPMPPSHASRRASAHACIQYYTTSTHTTRKAQRTPQTLGSLDHVAHLTVDTAVLATHVNR